MQQMHCAHYISCGN